MSFRQPAPLHIERISEGGFPDFIVITYSGGDEFQTIDYTGGSSGEIHYDGGEVFFESIVAYQSHSEYDRLAARVDFTVSGKTIEVYNWELNWRDTYPLEAIASRIQNCLYPDHSYVVTIEGPNLEFWLTQGFQYLTPNKLIN